MIQLLLSLLVFAIVVGLVFYLLRLLPLSAPWDVVVRWLATLIAILVLVDMVFGGGWTGISVRGL